MRAFLKKEWMETVRSGRLFLLLLIFSLFGIMNPAIAKLTPWMMSVMSESLEDAGFVMTSVKVDAMTSWTQFYKNIPLALMIFVLLESSAFTSEYQKGTLIPVVTKGLPRHCVVEAKALMLYLTWSFGYFLSFGITLLYNSFFWDNSVVSHFTMGAVCYWLFGIWVISLLVFFSAVCENSSLVLLGTGSVAAGVYLLGLFPGISRYVPSKLMDGLGLLQGIYSPEDYVVSIIISCILSVLCFILAVRCFERRKI